MAKINNRDIYKNIDFPSLLDFLLGTKEEDGVTKSFPLRRMILQSTLRFLMDALTFIVIYIYKLFCLLINHKATFLVLLYRQVKF